MKDLSRRMATIRDHAHNAHNGKIEQATCEFCAENFVIIKARKYA